MKRNKKLENALKEKFDITLYIRVDENNFYYIYDEDNNLLESCSLKEAIAFCNGINYMHSYKKNK